MEENFTKENEYNQINQLYDECINYLKVVNESYTNNNYETELLTDNDEDPLYATIKNDLERVNEANNKEFDKPAEFKLENECIGSTSSLPIEGKSERLRKLSQQLPKIIITQSNSSLNVRKGEKEEKLIEQYEFKRRKNYQKPSAASATPHPIFRQRPGYGDFPKRLVSKTGVENVALISNVPFEKIRLLNDTFHTLINLRWRWIITGTIFLHFAIWLVFALFWYFTALAHYDFEPDPPARTCVTGGKDFVTIFLASVEAQTTIGFGDRAIDEECPESIFLFTMQLILGTGLSGVLTCVMYAKLTRPEKMTRDGVGFSKKAVVSMRDGKLCLMMRAWDLNYDHIIGSEFSAHFVNTYRTKEGECLRYYARPLRLQQRQFLLWPVTLVHELDVDSPLYGCSPEMLTSTNYEITLSLKGASASMGTFTQSQTSYLPRELLWGYRFPSVVKYDSRKQKYVIDVKKLDTIEPVDTPYCSASQLQGSPERTPTPPGTPCSFTEKMNSFRLKRTTSFQRGQF